MSLNEKTFNINELRPCIWQHKVRHEQINCFQLGEIVFLKCNPNVPMKIIGFNYENDTVITKWKSTDGEILIHEFIPLIILQYTYAGLLITHRSLMNHPIEISLN